MKKQQETKNIQGVFVNIAGKNKTTKIDSFLKKFPPASNGKYSEELNKLIKKYKELYDKHQDGLNELANIEQLILQMSSRRDLSPIKYSTVKGLIYARTPFYRIGYKIKDIRVIVDDVEYSPSILKAIESKLTKQQEQEQMKFEINIAKKDAEIQTITAEGKAKSILLEAEAQAKAQKLISESLTQKYIQLKAMENPNNKLIFVPNGKDALPILLNSDGK